MHYTLITQKQQKSFLFNLDFMRNIFFVIALMCLCGCTGNEQNQKVYLIKETNYIHSSKNKADCKFIGQAEEEGYHIEKLDFKLAPYSKCEICKSCFSPTQVDQFNEKRNKWIERKMKAQYERERRDSLVNSVDEETRQAIIDDYLENLEYDGPEDYDNEYRSPYYRD